MSNYLIADLISKINLGAKRRLRKIKVNYNLLSLNIIKILYNQGALRTFIIKNNQIWIFFKYYLKKIIINLSIISKPSNRINLTLNKLSYYYNNNNFSGFFIISSQKGLYTSTSCILKEHKSGELLIKVEL